MKRTTLAALALVCGCRISHAAALPRVELEPLAMVGDIAPGTGGATYRSPRWLRSSSDGRYSWLGILSNGEQGLWVRDSTGTRLVAHTGSGSPYSEFFEQGSGFINSSGDVTLVTVTPQGQQVVLVGNGADRVVLRPNQPAPGLPGLRIADGPVGVLILDSGLISFRRRLAGAGVGQANDNSIWIGPPNDYQLVIREGDPAPGLPGRKIGSLVRGYLTNDNGFTAVNDNVDGVGGVIWAGTPGDMQLVAAEGQPAPGTNGLEFGSFVNRVARVTAADKVAFAVPLRDGATGQNAGDGLWFGSRDDIRLILGPDSPSPFANGAQITSIDDLAVNNFEQAVFRATLSLDGITQRVLLQTDLNNPEETAIIASVGDVAPGGTAEFTWLLGGAINDRGDVLFSGRLDGFGAANFGHGFWIKPRGQDTQLLVREQQLVDILPGPGEDLRQVESVGLTTGLSQNGSVGFSLNFEDGPGGLFVARVVPEPSALLSAVVVFVSLSLRTARHRNQTVFWQPR